MTENNSKNLDLPKGWTKSIIENLISDNGIFCDGDWVESKDQDRDGEIRLIQLADIGDGFFKDKSDKFLTVEKSIELHCTFLEKGDILVARLPDPLGRACIFPLKETEKFITVVDVCIIRLSNNSINNKYLLYLINSPQTRLGVNKYQSGSTRKRISRKNFAKIEFPIAPLPEQHRIVDKIEELFSELDNGVESLKKSLKQLKLYRQAVLKWAFEGKLTEAWRTEHQDTLEDAQTLLTQIKAERERHYQQKLEEWEKAVKDWQANGKEGKKPTKPQKLKELPPLTEEELSELPSLPDGWCWVRLEKITNKITDGEHFRPKTTDEGVYFLSAKDILSHGVSFDNPLFISQETAQKALLRCHPERGDILIVSRGATVGRLCIVKTDKVFCLLGSVILIKVNNLLNNFFLGYALKSPFLQKNMLLLSGSTAQQAIYIRDIKTLPIPICSLQEQSQIVQEIESRLSICDQLEATITDNLIKAEALRQSILKRAFEGKLVPQNPDDEPASELLKRLNCD